jgi:hypothetical protein
LSEQAAFIEAADAICGQLTSEIDALEAPTTIEATTLYLQQRIVLASRAREELRALVPPAPPDTGTAVLDALVDALDASNAKATEAVAVASSGNGAQLGPLLDEARDLGHAAIPVADTYGMHECGSE